MKVAHLGKEAKEKEILGSSSLVKVAPYELQIVSRLKYNI